MRYAYIYEQFWYQINTRRIYIMQIICSVYIHIYMSHTMHNIYIYLVFQSTLVVAYPVGGYVLVTWKRVSDETYTDKNIAFIYFLCTYWVHWARRIRQYMQNV